MPESLALARALDESGHVGHDEAVVAGAHHAEVGDERGEGVVRDLGPGGAHASDERALPHGGKAHERGVGHELELELDPVLMRGLALLGEGGRAARGRDEMGVAASPGAAGGDHDALAGVREVGQALGMLHGGRVELPDHSPQRNLQQQVLAVLTILFRALAVRTALGTEMVLETVVDQGGELGVGNDHDVAAAPAVAAIGSSLGHERLAPERHAARAAVAAAHIDAAHIGELAHRVLSNDE